MTGKEVEVDVGRRRGQQERGQQQQRVTLRGHRGSVLAACFAGRYALTAGADKSVRLFNPTVDADTAREIAVFAGPHGYPLVDVAVSNDSSAMACCGDDKCGFVWDVEEQQVVQRLYGHAGPLTTTRFAPTNNLVVTGAKDCTARIYDLRSRNPAGVMTLRGFRDSLTAVHVLEAEILAASVDGTLRTFDVRRGLVTTDHLGKIATMDVSSSSTSLASLDASVDGSCVLIGCVDPGMICLMERSSGRVLQAFRGHVNASARIPAKLYGPRKVDNNNKNKYACVGSERGELWMWDVETGRKVLQEHMHEGPLSALACSSSGSHGLVLTAGYDGNVFVHCDILARKM
ncbi:Guanine nucleotide-binding protein subunit beta-1 [Hondaea fermentalgiana]|uniref:Guanine nucleotide-binding protein subunit beta-1 n=1 Tax=Hondaea fermentalgiana TaxID=2315210 RepID=A0A2R5GVN5_9STRA|nr:Guanine nucleotide-binding protein subunit beta-1 [Hondaea fermentalgiana]|eukprot:GBG34897.1 Guanine nucleotide-binding protein subunit beta-1 [Hondaea fermentalgiana]